MVFIDNMLHNIFPIVARVRIDNITQSSDEKTSLKFSIQRKKLTVFDKIGIQLLSLKRNHTVTPNPRGTHNNQVLKHGSGNFLRLHFELFWEIKIRKINYEFKFEWNVGLTFRLLI